MKKNLQLVGKIATNHGAEVISGTTNAVSKNKKKKLKQDLDFIAIKKN